MVGALIGAVTCGRCGSPLEPNASDGHCFRCGARRAPASSGSALGRYSGLLSGVQSAQSSRRRTAIVIDAVPVVVGGILIGIALAGGFGAASEVRLGVIVPVALALVVYLVVSVVAWRRRGRSLGWLLLRLRTVDDVTGAPPRFASSGRAGIPIPGIRYDLVVADLRRGRDPLESGTDQLTSATLAPPVSPRGHDAVPAASTGRDPYSLTEPSPEVVLVLDTGERLSMETTLLVGRLPVRTSEEEHPVFAWPDISRSLSRTHALLEWTGTVLWVTDLRSGNGSALVGPDGLRQPLVPGLRGPAAGGWTVELGDRSFEVHPSGVLAVSEATVGRDRLLRTPSASEATAAGDSEGADDGR